LFSQKEGIKGRAWEGALPRGKTETTWNIGEWGYGQKRGFPRYMLKELWPYLLLNFPHHVMD